MAATPQPMPAPRKAPIQAVRHTFKLAVTLKKLAWRGTATVAWLHFSLTMLFDQDLFRGIELGTAQRLNTSLASLGFTPANPVDLWRILKIGWLLLITGFSAAQIVGFGIYVVLFPVTALCLVLFREVVKESSEKTAAEKPGLRPVSSGWPIFGVSGWLLLTWFSLFGEATSRREVLAGVILSGFFFLLLCYRAFRGARPISEGQLTVLNKIGEFGVKLLSDSTQKLESTALNKPQLAGSARLNNFFLSFFRKVALAIRGRRGRNRMALLLLLNYVASLIVLGAGAVFFWALAMKYASYPDIGAFGVYLQASASHFLPGVPQVGRTFASWTEVGASATAWILFVLFAGPAASILPETQRDYLTHLQKSYRVFRLLTLGWGRYVKALRVASTKGGSSAAS